MAHFAKINTKNIVTEVVVIPNEQEYRGVTYCKELFGGTWKQTSYNGTIRKNFAGIGYKYDKVRDAFIAPEPNDSIGFDEETCQWIIPIIETPNI